MVTTFSMLLINFGWNGFTEAVIQRETIDRFMVSNLFWINAGAGALLTIAFASAGSLLAEFYGDARVAQVSAAQADIFPLLNASSVASTSTVQTMTGPLTETKIDIGPPNPMDPWNGSAFGTICSPSSRSGRW